MVYLNVFAQMAQNFAEQSSEKMREARESGTIPTIDAPAIAEAVSTLSAVASGFVAELVAMLPANTPATANDIDEEARKLLNTEVDKIVGRLGLVQEDELAALRRRVVELEDKIANLSQ